MKCLSLVIHANTKQNLVDLLQSLPEVQGYTLYAGEGHSRDTSSNPFENTRDAVVGYVPRLRLDLVLADEAVASVLERLKACNNCTTGRGVFWVTAIEAWGSL